MLKDDDYTNPKVVIIDLGMSQAFTAGGEGPCGTPGYIPPETWRSGKWFPRGDMFAFGVTCLQLLAEKIPDEPEHDTGKRGIFTEGVASMDQVIMATETRLPPFHLMKIQSPALQQWLQICLDKRMHMRQRAPQILDHPWFTGVSDVGSPNRSTPASRPASPRPSYTVPGGVAQLPTACIRQQGPALPASPAIAQPARVASPLIRRASPEVNPRVAMAPAVFGSPRPAAYQPLVAAPTRYAGTAIRSPMGGSPVGGSPVMGRSPTAKGDIRFR